ncbi:MAG: HAMP domain-containing protein [Desulfovibrionales bacterium]|nr:HAMP domain-containing protein [Desulfovibrionales bacterium]
MHIFRTSLGAKILGLTFLTLVIVFGALIALILQNQKSTLFQEIEINAGRTAQMLNMAIRDPMIIGNDAGTTQKIREAGERYQDIDIYLTNFKGRITYSTQDSLLRTPLEETLQESHLRAMLQDRLAQAGKSELVTEINGRPKYVEMISIPNEPSCYHCHGQSQPVLGVMTVSQDISRQMRGLVQSQLRVGGLMAVSLVVLLAALFGAMRRTVLVPIQAVLRATERISQGDLTVQLPLSSQDEIGQLAKGVNTMTRSMSKAMGEIVTGVDTLVETSGQLHRASRDVVKIAEENQALSQTMAEGSQVMSQNMGTVAAASEEVTVNLSTVAAAAEEMSATIDEISRSTVQTKAITTSAVTTAEATSQDVANLVAMAQEIESVTQSISDISSQTNLLALNATIEAARAGDAGRGFAVVANEIKELANQTTRATEEIQDKIHGIQNATQKTTLRITEITSIIAEIDSVVTTIVAAIEEQAVTTRDIASNIGQASQGLDEVNQNVNQGAGVAENITQETIKVSTSAQQMSQSGDTVQQHAENLQSLAEQLKDLVHLFTLE